LNFSLLLWGYLVIFTKVLPMYHSWIHPLHLLSPSSIPGIVSTGFIFPFFHTGVHDISTIFTLSLCPPPNGYQLSRQDQ
jgi:hypothetical protein